MVSHASQDEGRPVVVGVDGSPASKGAVAWAARVAARSSRPLLVTMVAEDVPEYVQEALEREGESFDAYQYASRIIGDVRAAVIRERPDLDVELDVRTGSRVDGLVSASESAGVMVVGKRGLGAIKRIALGSTSIGLAGRSHAPTIVVPEHWATPDHYGEPVLAAITPDHENDALLSFAFETARDVRAPLVIVFVWQTHPGFAGRAADATSRGNAAQALVESVVAPWRTNFPDVPVTVTAAFGHSPANVIDETASAQLLVVGRRSDAESTFGFGLGSTSRAVLHNSEIPVAIVPTKLT